MEDIDHVPPDKPKVILLVSSGHAFEREIIERARGIAFGAGIDLVFAESIDDHSSSIEVSTPPPIPICIKKITYIPDKKHLDKLDRIPVPQKYKRNRFSR